jgi:hypothetical protein
MCNNDAISNATTESHVVNSDGSYLTRKGPYMTLKESHTVLNGPLSIPLANKLVGSYLNLQVRI